MHKTFYNGLNNRPMMSKSNKVNISYSNNQLNVFIVMWIATYFTLNVEKYRSKRKSTHEIQLQSDGFGTAFQNV